MPDISVVIISWKMKDLLKLCLNSIFKYSENITFEIILVDNNSCDGTYEMAVQEFSNIRIIRNNENKGVAPARKQGMEIAKGKYILILDADTELIENSLKCLFDYMEANNDCGVAGCKLVDSNLNLQYSCKRFPSLLALIFRRLEHIKFVAKSNILRKHIMMDWAHNEIREVDYLIGACQFIRREVIEKIGYYDTKIFYGPEDIDYCLRVWKAGWKVIYYPFTKIIHHEQRVTKRDFFSKISFQHLKGILYLYRKYGCRIKL